MKMITKAALLIGSIFMSCMAIAQMPYIDTAWVSQSPVVDPTYFHSSTIVVSGKPIVTSNTINGNGDTDILTIKFDSDGDTLWQKTFSGTAGGDDYGIELAYYGDYVYVTGTVLNTTTGYDYCLLKYKISNGDLVWNKTWDGQGGGMDIPSSIAIESNGSAIYVAGGTEASNGLSDFGILKYTNLGSLSWSQYYDYNDLHDGATTISVTPFTVVTSGGSAANIGDWDLATVTISKLNGSVMSTNRSNIPGATMVEASAMTTDSLNNVYITGYAEVSGVKNIQTIKLDSTLSLDWITNYAGNYDDEGRDIVVDANYNVYVTGYTEIADGLFNSILVKYNQNGDTLWTSLYGNTDYELGAKAEKMTMDNSGFLYITGTREDYDTIGSFFFNKYNDDGALLLSSKYNSYNNDERAYDIQVEADSVYITGLSSSSSGSSLTVLKYTMLQDVNPGYFYLNDEKSYWCQQPGMYSFALTDSSEFSGTLDSTVVEEIVRFNEGIHYVYFYPDASESEIDSAISIIEADSNFYKEYMVATLTRNNTNPNSDEYYAGLDNYINIIFQDTAVSLTEVDSFATLYGMDVAFSPASSIYGGVYILVPDPRDSIYDLTSATLTMDIAADMWENDSLNFISKVVPSLRLFRPDDPNDPKYSDMWYAEDNAPYVCNGTEVYNVGIDLDCAWNLNNEFGTGAYYSGDGIVVAVIDFDGAEYSHPDCAGMYDNGFITPSITQQSVVVPILTDTYNSTVDFRAHGQNVSGIIGARINNNEGLAGVAHNATIMPCLFDGTTAQFNALLMTIFNQSGADEVDIINMSFGYGGMSLADAQGYPFYSSLYQCYQLGRPNDPPTTGRGIPLIASAGNSNGNVTQVPAQIPFVFSVAATTPFDEVKVAGDDFDPVSGSQWGSSYFSDLDVAAPGVCIISTDFTDDNQPAFPSYGGSGYTTGDYYSFYGTSASAPIVSGIAALVLEKDGTLTVNEVYDVIRYSCEKVGGYTYNNNWETGRCLELGYGRVNACMALQTVDELSVEEPQEAGFNIYHANPVNGLLQVIVDGSANYSITLTNLIGEIVYSSDMSSTNSFEIDMQGLSNGVYILNITDLDGNGSRSSKIIKQ